MVLEKKNTFMFSLGKLLHMVTCILPCIAFKLSLKMFNTSISENEKNIL